MPPPLPPDRPADDGAKNRVPLDREQEEYRERVEQNTDRGLTESNRQRVSTEQHDTRCESGDLNRVERGARSRRKIRNGDREQSKDGARLMDSVPFRDEQHEWQY